MPSGPADSVRIESDLLGEMEVPADALWGASTQRALLNFPISGERLPRRFLGALGLVKAAAARANVIAAGLDPKTALEIVSKSTGNNSFVQRAFPNNILKRGNFPSNFSIGLMHKDVRLATELGGDVGCPMPLTHIVQEMHQQGVNRSGWDGDVNDMIYVYEDLTGVRLSATREKLRKKKK